MQILLSVVVVVAPLIIIIIIIISLSQGASAMSTEETHRMALFYELFSIRRG